MRRRIVLPVSEDLAGLGECHHINHRIGIAAAGGEGAVEGGKLLAGSDLGFATGCASPICCAPALFSGRRRPAVRRTAVTASLSCSMLASRSRILSAVSSGYAGARPA